MASEPLMGTIFPFAGNFAPRGFALCNGQLLPISQYSALFAILGTTYGGNGQTNFALPDLQGRVPIGVGQGPGLADIQLGEASGQEGVTILFSNMPAHSHPLMASTATASSADPTGNYIAEPLDGTAGAGTGFAAGPPNTVMAPLSVGASQGGGIPLGIRNPFLAITYIIATEGIFPTRN